MVEDIEQHIRMARGVTLKPYMFKSSLGDMIQTYINNHSQLAIPTPQKTINDVRAHKKKDMSKKGKVEGDLGLS